MLALLLAATVLSAPLAEVDDFDEPALWRGPIHQYGNLATGTARVAGGLLTVVRRPGGRYHMLSMERDLRADPASGLWVHFRFRMEERLLGADLYATVTVGGRTLAQMGVNGEMHWRMFERCRKKPFDDELFFGSDLIAGEDGGKRSDIRLALPPARAGRILYTDWHVFSVGVSGAPGRRRVTVLVDGLEPIYRDLDAAAPAGVVDMRVPPERDLRPGPADVRVSFGVFADGDLYGDTRVNDGAGVRWLHAFADDTPAEPHPSDPRLAVKREARMHWDWLIVHDGAGARLAGKRAARLVRAGRLDPAVARRLGWWSAMGRPARPRGAAR